MFEPNLFGEFLTRPRQARSAVARRDEGAGSPFFAYFLWRSKESEAAAGRIPALKPHAVRTFAAKPLHPYPSSNGTGTTNPRFTTLNATFVVNRFTFGFSLIILDIKRS